MKNNFKSFEFANDVYDAVVESAGAALAEYESQGDFVEFETYFPNVEIDQSIADDRGCSAGMHLMDFLMEDEIKQKFIAWTIAQAHKREIALGEMEEKISLYISHFSVEDDF